jgi:hypothetical protein
LFREPKLFGQDLFPEPKCLELIMSVELLVQSALKNDG